MIALLRYNGGTLFTTNLYWNYANGKSFKTYHCSLILPVVFRLSTEQACWLWSSLKRLNACLCDLSPGSLHFGWILFHFLCSAIWWNFYCRLQMNVKAAPLNSQRHAFNGSDLVFAPCSIKIDTCAPLSTTELDMVSKMPDLRPNLRRKKCKKRKFFIVKFFLILPCVISVICPIFFLLFSLLTLWYRGLEVRLLLTMS